MPPAQRPSDESERLAALRSYEILDTACERSFDEIAALAAKLTGSPIGLVSLVDDERQWFKARFGLDVTETHRDDAFCSHAILGSELFEVPDASQDPRFADNPLVVAGPEIRFYAGVPLINPEGFALGTLCVIDHAARVMDASARETLAALARTAMTTLELHRALKQARTLALTDALTGLPNRVALLDALDRAIAQQRRHGDAFALMYLDLDGFKAVNDAQSHAAGDRALRVAANTLRTIGRREDIAARIGGDEFAVVLVKCDAVGLPMVAERMRLGIAKDMAAAAFPVTASVGAVMFTNPPAGVGDALAVADRLMYRAKSSGKNQALTAEYPQTASSGAPD